MSPTRIPGTPSRRQRDGSSLPDGHATAIYAVDPPSRLRHLWLRKPLDRPFWSPSAPGTPAARKTEGRRASKKLRSQVIANNIFR